MSKVLSFLTMPLHLNPHRSVVSRMAMAPFARSKQRKRWTFLVVRFALSSRLQGTAQTSRLPKLEKRHSWNHIIQIQIRSETTEHFVDISIKPAAPKRLTFLHYFGNFLSRIWLFLSSIFSFVLFSLSLFYFWFFSFSFGAYRFCWDHKNNFFFLKNSIIRVLKPLEKDRAFMSVRSFGWFRPRVNNGINV